MAWQILDKASQSRKLSPSLNAKPRLLRTAPIHPNFNLSCETEDEDEWNVAEQPQVSSDFTDSELQAEMDAWDAASDEAFEELEDTLPE